MPLKFYLDQLRLSGFIREKPIFYQLHITMRDNVQL